MTAFEIVNPGDVLVVNPSDVPNPNWLAPSIPSAGQQAFGDALLKANAVLRTALAGHDG